MKVPMRGLTGAAALMMVPLASEAAQLSTFGTNRLQTATGAAVQAACGGMIPIAPTLTGNSLALFNRCGELVHTANQLAKDGTTTAKSLGISAAQLAGALQDVAPEETEVMGSGLTDTSQDQLSSLQDRLQFLRTGTSAFPITSLYQSGATGGTAGDDDFSRLGVFVNGIYGFGNKDAVDSGNGVENAFEFDAYGFTAGIDYRFNDQFVGGAAFGYVDSGAEFDGSQDTSDSTGQTFSLYGSYYQDVFFLDGSLSFANYDYDGVRRVNYPNNLASNPSAGQPIVENLLSTTSGDSTSWSIAAGYNKNVDDKNFTLSASLQGIDATIDGYTETGGALAMTLGQQEVKSMQSVVSAQASIVMSQTYGILVPFATLAWHHEFDDENRGIRAIYAFDPNSTVLNFSTDPGDSDYAVLSLGASLVMIGGGQLFVSYDTALGLQAVSSHVFTVGYRWEL